MPPASTGPKQTKFQKGKSGNPAGRPKGARNRVSVAVETLLEGDASRLTQKAVQLALKGNVAALKICLDRVAPPVKERSVEIELPDLNDPESVVAASAKVIAAIAKGEIGLTAGETLLRLLDAHRRALESADLETRLAKLESFYVKGR